MIFPVQRYSSSSNIRKFLGQNKIGDEMLLFAFLKEYTTTYVHNKFSRKAIKLLYDYHPRTLSASMINPRDDIDIVVHHQAAYVHLNHIPYYKLVRIVPRLVKNSPGRMKRIPIDLITREMILVIASRYGCFKLIPEELQTDEVRDFLECKGIKNTSR